MQPGEEPDTVVDPSVIAERRFRRSGSQRHALEQRIAEIEEALAAARGRADELAARLEVRERELAEARESAFAEQRRRLEVEAEAGRDRHDGDAETARLRASLAGAEARIAELEEQVAGEREALAGVRVAELETLLAEERRARSAQRRAFEAHIAALGRGIAAAREQLAALGEGLAAERRIVDERLARVESALVSAHLLAATGGASDAEALVAVRALTGTAEDEEGPAQVAPPPMPAADHPALAETTGPAPSGEGMASVIDGLARAAQRLREQTAPEAEAEAEAEAPAPAIIELPSRAGAGRQAGWIAPALAALAARDAAAAARLLLAAAPLQAARLGGALEYVLAPEPLGVHCVALAPQGGCVVAAGAVEGAPRVAGPASALAPLLAGGARRRRLPGAEMERRRRLRRLLKALRAPVGLAELAAAGVEAEPADVLALLAAAVDPAASAGGWRTVGFAVAEGGAAALRAAEGARPVVVAGVPGDADAVVHAPSRPGLLAILAGTAPVPVSGDVDAAAAVLGLLDGAQNA